MAGGDGAEDEVYDDDNDFEGMDVIGPPGDGQLAMHFGQAPMDGLTNTHPFMTMPSSAAAPGFAAGAPAGTSATNAPGSPLSPLAFSSFMTNAPADGQPPLSAYGQAQASVASLSHQGSGALTNGAHAATGASSAPLHHMPDNESSG